MTDQDLAAVLEQHQEALMAILGVVGVGLGRRDDAPVIQIFVLPVADQDLARRRAAEILPDTPMDFVPMQQPEAQGGP